LTIFEAIILTLKSANTQDVLRLIYSL